LREVEITLELIKIFDSQCLGKSISNLVFVGYELDTQLFVGNSFPNKMIIYLDVFCRGIEN
jgi:hypothetical protein